MHELAVTENILNIVLKHAQKENATRVTDIHIVIGRLSSIVDDSVQFYWDLITENTICDKARLHFQRIPVRMLCLNCNHEYVIDQDMTPCPECSSLKVKVLTGEEFWLDSIEIVKE